MFTTGLFEFFVEKWRVWLCQGQFGPVIGIANETYVEFPGKFSSRVCDISMWKKF